MIEALMIDCQAPSSEYGYRGGCRCSRCTEIHRLRLLNYLRSERGSMLLAERQHGRHREMSSEQVAAHSWLQRQLRLGRLRRPETCEKCDAIPGQGADGRSLIYAHIPDPLVPEDHVWLCSLCVGELRRNEREARHG